MYVPDSVIRGVLKARRQQASQKHVPREVIRKGIVKGMELLGGPDRYHIDRQVVGGVPVAYVPHNPQTPAAEWRGTLLWLHGGAYEYGTAASAVGFGARYAFQAGLDTVGVDYRLAPEHPFPAGLNDVLAVYRARLAAGHAAEKHAVGGDSAGGGLTLAFLLAAKAEGLPLPKAALVSSPWTDLTLSGDSYKSRQDREPMLVTHYIDGCASGYAGGTPRTHPWVSPLFASREELSGLPPIRIDVGDDEILLDDARRFADRARAAGLDVTCEVWAGMWHVFPAFAKYSKTAQKGIDAGAAFLREKLR